MAKKVPFEFHSKIHFIEDKISQLNEKLDNLDQISFP